MNVPHHVMNALYLPELRPLISKNVEIIVEEKHPDDARVTDMLADTSLFGNLTLLKDSEGAREVFGACGNRTNAHS